MVYKNIVASAVIAAVGFFAMDSKAQDVGDALDKTEKLKETQKQDPDDAGLEDPNHPLGKSKMRSFGISDGGNKVAPANRKRPGNSQSPGNHDLVDDVFGQPGGKTFSDQNGRRTIKIIHNDTVGIFIEVVITYGPKEVQQLIRKHPELADYVELFPKQVGDHEIGLNVAVTSKYRANTLEELAENHPAGFNLYRRYYKKEAAKTKK